MLRRKYQVLLYQTVLTFAFFLVGKYTNTSILTTVHRLETLVTLFELASRSWLYS